ncbi:hypothetical protein [Alcaligenes faecalis]|uniref:hypothetical protein n=1 Tax=Alcaligenes faecalis TaxID=511 RepID=UPI000F0B457C|nr:hypothetical protein [Alcaligenes faecalis]AYR19468.1 hypothetical protein D6I95_03265 [Alcaligenes faecalis]
MSFGGYVVSAVESIKSLSLTELKKYAKAIRAKIKTIKISSSIDEKMQAELKDLDGELDLVSTVIADKEIDEAKQQMTKNNVLQVLKNTKPK